MQNQLPRYLPDHQRQLDYIPKQCVQQRGRTDLMHRPTLACLQRLDRTTDAAPYGPPIGIAQLKHAVDHPRRLDQCIRAVSTDNQIGRAVDVQVRDHDASLAGWACYSITSSAGRRQWS